MSIIDSVRGTRKHRTEGRTNMTRRIADIGDWISRAIGKRTALNPVYVGSKGGRKIYSVAFEDGSEADYYIDFDRREVEEY